MRRLLGKPGSLRRWILGSVVWLAVCVGLFLLTLNPFVLLFALLLDMAAFLGRTYLVGDEDEFNASLGQSLVSAVRDGVPPTEREEIHPELWFARGSRLYDDVPPPPTAESSTESERSAASGC